DHKQVHVGARVDVVDRDEAVGLAHVLALLVQPAEEAVVLRTQGVGPPGAMIEPELDGRTGEARTASARRRRVDASGSEDPLLRDRPRADTDELADGRIDQPGRIIVAVAEAGANDAHELIRAELLATTHDQRHW